MRAEAPKHPVEIVNRTIVELSKIARDSDLSRAAHDAQPLFGASDDLLAHALMSLVYALDIGAPDGTTLMGGDMSRRHDFGLDTKDRAQRTRDGVPPALRDPLRRRRLQSAVPAAAAAAYRPGGRDGRRRGRA